MLKRMSQSFSRSKFLNVRAFLLKIFYSRGNKKNLHLRDKFFFFLMCSFQDELFKCSYYLSPSPACYLSSKSSFYSYMLWGIQPNSRQWKGMWTITSKLQRSQMEFEKQKPAGGTRSRKAFKRAGPSAEFQGSKAMRRIKPLQGNKT